MFLFLGERIYVWIVFIFLEIVLIEIFNLVIFFIVWYVLDFLFCLNDLVFNDLCNKMMECYWIMVSFCSGLL